MSADRLVGMNNLQLFALGSSRLLGEQVARCLETSVANHEERNFGDGEHKTRSLESVRNNDVYVLQSLTGDTHGSVNDKLCRLLFFLGSLRDAGAGRITAVLPYLCYSRKDSRTKSRDPVTSRYVAQLLEAVGTHRVVTFDAHNPAALDNAYRCQAEHLEAGSLFANYLCSNLVGVPIVVVSPDIGGVKRAERLRTDLESRLKTPVGRAFLDKYRSEGVVSGGTLVGQVRGKVVVLVDDLISGGNTLRRAVTACSKAGALSVYAVATHGLFSDEANISLDAPSLERIVVTDTVSPFRLTSESVRAKLVVLEIAPFLSRALREMHQGNCGDGGHSAAKPGKLGSSCEGREPRNT
jgi:ribose-phosphate pyrophosphokinase